MGRLSITGAGATTTAVSVAAGFIFAVVFASVVFLAVVRFFTVRFFVWASEVLQNTPIDRATKMHFKIVFITFYSVSYTHLRAHETGRNLVCRLLLEKKK